MTREVLHLLGKGVPWDVVMSMSTGRRRGFIIASREMTGTERYDWETSNWVNVS